MEPFDGEPALAPPTFIICSEEDSPETEEKVLGAFGDIDNAYVIRKNSQWLVATDMTTQQVYAKIAIDGEHKIRIVIFSILNHWGYHKKDMWEWLALD